MILAPMLSIKAAKRYGLVCQADVGPFTLAEMDTRLGILLCILGGGATSCCDEVFVSMTPLAK